MSDPLLFSSGGLFTTDYLLLGIRQTEPYAAVDVSAVRLLLADHRIRRFLDHGGARSPVDSADPLNRVCLSVEQPWAAGGTLIVLAPRGPNGHEAPRSPPQ